jgi:hypothetical protein
MTVVKDKRRPFEITKIDTIENIKTLTEVYAEVKLRGFELPECTSGLFDLQYGYIREEDYGQPLIQKAIIGTDYTIDNNIWAIIIERLLAHLTHQKKSILSFKESTENPSFVMSNLDVLKTQSILCSSITFSLEKFINKLTLNLCELPKVFSHNNLHLNNILERGIIGWKFAGINYLGYDSVVPFRLSSDLGEEGLFINTIGRKKYKAYFSALDSLAGFELSKHFSDFYMLKLALLCVDIEDKPKLYSWRYSHLNILGQKFLKNEDLFDLVY